MAQAADTVTLPFQTHAAFFSAETKQPSPLDPQVFVADAVAPAAIGPQGIKHVAGVRPAFIQTDPGTTPLLTADGAKLGYTLAEWLAPSGTVTLTPGAGSTVLVKIMVQRLRPAAQYSVFENHFDQAPIGFTALDGAGTSNSFKTDSAGAASVTVTSPQPITHANAIILVLDEDGQTHGNSRGDVGNSARHQLIARPAG